jgi:hypothetical protein
MGPLENLVLTLVLGDDEKCEALIAIVRLIDMADDNDKCLITALTIEYAYSHTTNHRAGLTEYLTNLINQSSEYAQLVAAYPCRRSEHASKE